MVVNSRPLGGALRRAWVGYQRQLDARMADAGFGDRGFPDGRVLRLCARVEATTASQIARELGISRQAASKIVNRLRDRGYVALETSAHDARAKQIALTPRGADYLATQRRSARAIERELRAEIGAEAFNALWALVDALGGDDQPRMSDYLRGSYRGEGRAR